MSQTHGAASSSMYVLTLSTVAAVGGFLFGFDSGVINGTVDALQLAFGSSSVGTGFSVASMLLGCAAGAFFAGTLANRFGRRSVMVATAILFGLSAWGSGVAGGTVSFVLYRVVGGAAVGAASVIAPMYISEVAPAHMRGRLTSLQQLAIVVGLLSAFLSNYAIAASAGSAKEPFLLGFDAWRWMFWVELIPSLLFLLGSVLVPESPRYLVANGKDEVARRVFAKVGTVDVDKQIAEVKESLHGVSRPKIGDLIDKATGAVRPIVWIGIALAMLQQLVGINVIFYYGAVLWQAAGFSESEALLTNIISGVVNLASTFIAIALVDRVGRKPLLLVGSVGMAVCLAALAFIFGNAEVTGPGQVHLAPNFGKAALFFANAYVVFFASTWGPVLWILLGEMFSNRLRGAAVAVATMLHWLANFSVTMSFPVLLRGLGLSAAYSLYAVAAAISFVIVWRFVSETKGMTLESMKE